MTADGCTRKKHRRGSLAESVAVLVLLSPACSGHTPSPANRHDGASDAPGVSAEASADAASPLPPADGPVEHTMPEERELDAEAADNHPVPPDTDPDLTPDAPADLGPMPPARPACPWEGPRCSDGETQLCAGGHLIAVQTCHVLGCRDATNCVAPGSPSALARQGQNGVSSCGHPGAPSTTCPMCLRNTCCNEGVACTSDDACFETWGCLQTCSGLTACDACLAGKATSKALAALFACITGPCSGRCQFLDYCQAAPGDGYFCGSRLGVDADRAVLYLCRHGTTLGVVSCPGACGARPTGLTDACEGPDPCINFPFDGAACGSLLGSAGADAHTLYECKGQKAIASTPCNVCNQPGPGQAYDCR